LLLNFSLEALKKLPLYEKIPHEKSYLNILNGNQDNDELIFWVFLTVHGYLMISGDKNLTIHSLIYKESKCFEISRLSFIGYEITAFCVFVFNSAQHQCNDLNMENTGLLHFCSLKSVVYVVDMC
jgi:hypothetical protein